MSSNFNNAKIINVYYNKGDRKPYDVNGKPIAYIGEEFIGANEATEIRFFFGEELDSASAIIVAKRANNDTRLDPLELVGTGVNAYFKIRLNAWYAEYKGKMTIIFKVYNGTVTYDDPVTPTQIVSTTGQIIVSDIFNLEVAYAPNASSLVPPFETEDYDDWFFTLSTKLDKAQSITVTGALPTLTGDVYDDRYFYVEDEGVGRLYYINGSTAIEVVWQVGTLRLTPTGNGDITADTGKLSWNQPNGTAQLGLYNDVNIGLGEDVMYYGKASATITKGQVIQFGGYQGDHILIKPAVPSEINANPKLIMGIAKQAITSGDFGYVAHFGKIEGYDSDAFAVGSLLWFNSSSGSNGLLTATQPTAPNAKILMAALIKAETSGAANNGVLQVRITIEPKLSELKDVLLTNPQEEDVLLFDQNAGYWYNSPALQNAMSDIATLQSDVNIAESDIDSLEGRMTTAESNIVNIEDGTTVVQKALSDQNNDVIDTTYLKIASASATYIPLSQKGVANGVVPLGSNGKVPSIYLSGEQDDLAEFADLASFPAVGETDILYVALDTNKLYRWSGSAYVVISETLAIGTTNTTAFAGDRGLALEGVVNTTNQVDTGVVTWNASTGKFVSANNFIKTSGGNVGIGTSSPNLTSAGRTTVDVNGINSAIYALSVGGTASGFMFHTGTDLLVSNERNGVLGLNVNGDRRMTILPAGNVGIGTSSPATKLEVAGGQFRIFESGNTALKTYTANPGGFIVSYQSDAGSPFTKTLDIVANGDGTVPANMRFLAKANGASSPVERMRIEGSGNVGIGTTAPAERLDVLGVLRSSNANNDRLVFQQADRASAPSLSFAGMANGSAVIYSVGQGVAVPLAIGTYADTPFILATQNAERIRITGTGNVGIGTTSPALKLHVAGGTRITGVLEIRSDAETKRLVMDYDDSTDTGAIFAIQDGVSYKNLTLNRDGGNVGIGTNSPATRLDVNGVINTNNNISWANGNADINGQDTNLKFRTYTGSALTEKVRITSAGKVGIGTTSPTETLHITSAGDNGIIVGNTFDTSGNNWRLWTDNYDSVPNTNFLFKLSYGATDVISSLITGLVGIGTNAPTAQLQVKSNATNRVPLIVDTLASQTANLAEWRVNGSAVAIFDTNGRLFTSGGLSNAVSGNNALIRPLDAGTTISRNVADSNPALIVNLANASATGNIQVWQKAGTAVAQITNTGIFVGQSRPTRTDITANATLALADEGKVLRVNSASNLTVTIPLNSSVAFPTDTEIAILRYGTGTVSISPTAGVTLNSKNSETKISGQYGSVALKKIGENEWVLVGSLEA